MENEGSEANDVAYRGDNCRDVSAHCDFLFKNAEYKLTYLLAIELYQALKPQVQVQVLRKCEKST